MSSKRLLGALLGTVILTASGCAPSGVSGEQPAPSGTATPPSTAPTASAPVFQQPASCSELLPEAELADFAADALTLLGGPGGVYGDDYLADPTPEQRAGGITCIWGDADTTASSITISVAPLDAASREAVVGSLSGQGLNANVDGPIATFAILGDEDRRPAILNVLREDSWISVIMTIGGTAPFERALDLADQVAQTVYSVAG